MQCPRYVGEHRPVDMSRSSLVCDLGLKFRDQLGSVRVTTVSAIAQPLKQPPQEKQIAEGKTCVLARRRHVAGCTLEGGKDFLGKIFKVQIDIRRERRRPPLGDRERDPSSIFIGRRNVRLGLARRATRPPRPSLPIKSHVMVSGNPIAVRSKTTQSTGTHALDDRPPPRTSASALQAP